MANLLTNQRPRDDTVSGGDTNQQEGVTEVTKVNPEVSSHNTHSLNQTTARRQPSSTRMSADTSEEPSTIQCVQGNLRHSHQSQVNIFLDILNKNVYKNGIDVIFVTEPYTVSKDNSLTDVPDDVFNIFAQQGGRTALVTKGMCTWKVRQYCSKDVTVCQTKLNNKLTYLVSLYLNSKIIGLPNKF